jgi:hypothetical protein
LSDISNIPILDGEEWWSSKAIDDSMSPPMNTPQLMWLDVISATLAQPTFDMSIGNMGYVFKNMIAKYVSSADHYRVSEGVLNELIHPNSDLRLKIENCDALDMKKYFYGKDKPSLLEHMVPASVIAKALLDLGKQPNKDDVAYVLKNSGDVAIVLRSEDKLLLKSKMPSNWKIGDSTFARYKLAGVKLVDDYWVKRNKTIYR